MEIIFLLLQGLYSESIPLLFILVLGLIVRITDLHLNKPWIEIRKEITDMLVESGVISDDDKDLDLDLDHAILIDDLSSHESSRELVKLLRKVGIDGLILVLLLGKYRQSFISAKAMRSELGIPSSSLYRALNKLVEFQYVVTKSVIDNPSKKYYQITPHGEDIIIDLHELIPQHIPIG